MTKLQLISLKLEVATQVKTWVTFMEQNDMRSLALRYAVPLDDHGGIYMGYLDTELLASGYTLVPFGVLPHASGEQAIYLFLARKNNEGKRVVLS